MRRTWLVLTSATLLGLPALTGGAAFSMGAALAAPAAPMAAPAAQVVWTPEDVSELRQKARISRRAGGVTASFFVGATPQQAYQILTDHPQLPQFMPNLDACIVRKQGPGWAEVEMRNARGSMVLRRVFDPPRRIQWSLVEGTMLKRVDGSWRLDGIDGGTILTYDSEVETTVPVPAFIIQFVQQDSLSALVSNVRQRIDSRGTWIKPDFKQGTP